MRKKLKVEIEPIIKLVEMYKDEMSWRQVAKTCNLTPRQVIDLKNGKYNPGLLTLMKLANIAPLEERNDLYNAFLDYVELHP